MIFTQASSISLLEPCGLQARNGQSHPYEKWTLENGHLPEKWPGFHFHQGNWQELTYHTQKPRHVLEKHRPRCSFWLFITFLEIRKNAVATSTRERKKGNLASSAARHICFNSLQREVEIPSLAGGHPDWRKHMWVCVELQMRSCLCENPHTGRSSPHIGVPSPWHLSLSQLKKKTST